MGTDHPTAQILSTVVDAISASGLTRREVSERTGIPYSTLRRKLAGTTELSVRELFLIAEATGFSPAQLFSAPSGITPDGGASATL